MASAPPAEPETKEIHWTVAMKAENEELRARIAELEARVPTADPQDPGPQYELQPFPGQKVASFYDSMPIEGTAKVFHAVLSFEEMNGWSDSALRGWALAMAEYAFLDNRLGTTQTTPMKQGQPAIPGKPCSALGPFNPEGKLHVIIKFEL